MTHSGEKYSSISHSCGSIRKGNVAETKPDSVKISSQVEYKVLSSALDVHTS